VLWVQLKLLIPYFESINSHWYVTYTLTPLLNAGLMAGEFTAWIFPTKESNNSQRKHDLCILTLLVDDNSKQEIMAPSFSRPDPVHFLRACVWNYKMYSEVSRTEVNQNERIQDIKSPISPAKLWLTINNLLSNVMRVSEQVENTSCTFFKKTKIVIVIEIN